MKALVVSAQTDLAPKPIVLVLHPTQLPNIQGLFNKDCFEQVRFEGVGAERKTLQAINQAMKLIEIPSEALPIYLNDGVPPADHRLSASLPTIFITTKHNNPTGTTTSQLQEWRFRRLQDTRMTQKLADYFFL